MANFVQMGKAERDDTLRLKAARDSRTIIGLMGMTRAGKSDFIDTFTHRLELRQWEGDQVRTREVQQTQQYEWEHGKKVMFVEIPSFQNAPPFDTVILRKIAQYLVSTYEYYKFAGIIYLHDSNTPIDDDKSLCNFDMMCGIAGKDCNNHLRFVLNKCQPTDTDLEHMPGTWMDRNIRRNMRNAPLVNPMSEPRSDAIPQSTIRGLLLMNETITLALQKELILQKKTLQKTAAGSKVSLQLEKSYKKAKSDIREREREKKTVAAGSQREANLLQEIRDLKAVKETLAKELKTWKRLKERWVQLQSQN